MLKQKQNVCTKKILCTKKNGYEKNWVRKNMPKKLGSKTKFGQEKKLARKRKFGFEQKIGMKNFGYEKIRVRTNFGYEQTIKNE